MKSTVKAIRQFKSTYVYPIDEEVIAVDLAMTVNNLVWEPVWDIVRISGQYPLAEHLEEAIK